MKKNEPTVWLIWIGTILLSALIISVSAFSNNDTLSYYFPIVIFFGIIGTVSIISIIKTQKSRKRIKELRNNVPQIKVSQVHPPFPVYSIDSALSLFIMFMGICIYFLVTILLRHLSTLVVLRFLEIVGSIFIIYGIYACIKKIRTKALSFYQDDPDVSLYENDAVEKYINTFTLNQDNLDNHMKSIDFFPVERLRNYLSNDFEKFLSKKCEHIRFHNETEFWSCYADETRYHMTSEDYYTRKTNYIFAMIPFQSENRGRIVICNNEGAYLNQTELYIPQYSNLPPFVIWGKEVEKTCKKIESICSEFAAKTRATFVIEIVNGKIYIGLKHARFGRHFHFFNKELAKEQTRQAIEELTEFLLKIKAIME